MIFFFILVDGGEKQNDQICCYHSRAFEGIGHKQT